MVEPRTKTFFSTRVRGEGLSGTLGVTLDALLLRTLLIRAPIFVQKSRGGEVENALKKTNTFYTFVANGN